MSKRTLTPAARKLLERIAVNPVMSIKEGERSAAPSQCLLEMGLASWFGLGGGCRWIIHEAGWSALGTPPEHVARKLDEQRQFVVGWRQAIETRAGVPAQYDMFGRAA